MCFVISLISISSQLFSSSSQRPVWWFIWNGNIQPRTLECSYRFFLEIGYSGMLSYVWVWLILPVSEANSNILWWMILVFFRNTQIVQQNVYVVHQSDSRTSPPLIGLLSTASAPLVMNGLQSLRRNDTEASPGIKNDSIRHPNSSSLQPWALLLLSGLLAFVGSMLSAVLFRVIHDRMISKRAKIGREHGPAKSWCSDT